MARTNRSRPTRQVSVLSADAHRVTEPFEIEVGRRAGLHTHKSQVSERRVRANRRDRHADRAALRRDGADAVLSRPRSQAVWLAT